MRYKWLLSLSRPNSTLSELKREHDKLAATKDAEVNALNKELVRIKSEVESSQKFLDAANVELKSKHAEIGRIQGVKEKAEKAFADLEAKLKDVQRDADCKVHNSEATRLALEKKLKEQERELKLEIKEAQTSAAGLEKALAQKTEAADKSEKSMKATVEEIEARKS